MAPDINRPRLDRLTRKGIAEKGFTLMEVMVALSVVAIALTAIYRMHTQTLFMDARGRFDTVATMLARQKLAEIDTLDLKDLTSDAGDFDSDHPGYTWKIESEAVASDLIKADGPSLKRIILTIGFNEEESLFTLTTYRHLYE
ncbi:prepilin-type N-terminal cleavage/methylation domain-containing protein [Desulfosarcina sp.]|uniref:type IV pilus modification PilV family protein n=1 Tax=Desulfosarcina sp. TaxID=2027861 RepID=UPI00397092B8